MRIQDEPVQDVKPARPGTSDATSAAHLRALWGRFLLRRGDYAGARELLEQAVETYRRFMGEDHPLTLTWMGNLAIVMAAQGDYQRARELHVPLQRRREDNIAHLDAAMIRLN